jgi:hypothetical protein
LTRESVTEAGTSSASSGRRSSATALSKGLQPAARPRTPPPPRPDRPRR